MSSLPEQLAAYRAAAAARHRAIPPPVTLTAAPPVTPVVAASLPYQPLAVHPSANLLEALVSDLKTEQQQREEEKDILQQVVSKKRRAASREQQTIRAKPAEVWLEEFKNLHRQRLSDLPASVVKKLAAEAYKTLPPEEKRRIQSKAQEIKRRRQADVLVAAFAGQQ